MPSVAAPAGWNESAYLRANPDVAAAVTRAKASGIPYSGYDHYLRDGQRENRPTSPMLGNMTEAEYLARNPDVAAAVASGAFASGQDHWNRMGRNEVRPGGRGFNEFEKANPWAIGMTAAAVQAAQQRATAQAGPTPEQQRAAQVAGIRPRITGVDRWGAQLVGFDNVPAGLTLTNEELGRMAQNAGYGAAAVQQGWRDRGGKIGEAGPMAGDGMGKNLDKANPELWGPNLPKQKYTSAWQQANPELTDRPSWGPNLPGQKYTGGYGGVDSKAPAASNSDKNPDGTWRDPLAVMNDSRDETKWFWDKPATPADTPQVAGGGYDWGNPELSEVNKALFGNGGLPPEDDDEEKHRKAMLESTSGNRPW
ncbi:MAG: hypothetical protein ACKN9T_08955 [Candidatus Methylumidiphilus sp.]